MNIPVNEGRRRKLRVMLKLIITFIFMLVLWVSVSFFSVSDDVATELMPFKIPMSRLQLDKPIIIKWEERPVILMKRSPKVQALLAKADQSYFNHQIKPKNSTSLIKSVYRSQTKDVFVALATGTDFGCPVEHLPVSITLFMGMSWGGGFQDTCRGSRYDYAGRVYQGQNAKKDLVIPRYKITNGVIVLQGL